MTIPRSHKLGWIGLIMAIVGFLISEILGATTALHCSVVIAIPVVVGLAIGFLALDEDSESRNGKWVALAVGVVFLIVAILVGLAAYRIYSSTDL